jgi:hypothetical protein
MRKISPERPTLPASLLLACMLLIYSTTIHAGENEMQQQYQQIEARLTTNVYGIPVYIQSSDQDKTMLGEIYGVIYHPFDIVRDTITAAENWCAIVPQHLNIKACTLQRMAENNQLTFYAGRKFYENADDAYELSYRFEAPRTDDNYFQVILSADKGPLGTRDYRIEVEAVPLDGSRTFLHFSYSYKYNFITAMGTKIYLATIGRNKIGFTQTGTDDKGDTVYIEGIRGIIERNTMRYYFAIQSFLDTWQLEPGERLNARLNTWFDLTEKYPLQLRELDKEEYLQSKQQEHLDQLRIQQQVH